MSGQTADCNQSRFCGVSDFILLKRVQRLWFCLFIPFWSAFPTDAASNPQPSHLSTIDIEAGNEFLASKLVQWRPFGKKLRWYKVESETPDGTKIVWQSKPGFDVAHTTYSNGNEHVRMSNERYSAVITKDKAESIFRLAHIDEPYDVAAVNRQKFSPMSFVINDYLPDLIDRGELEVSAFESDGVTTRVWLIFSSSERRESLPGLLQRGDIELVFGAAIEPTEVVFETGGQFPQVNRLRALGYSDVAGEMLVSSIASQVEQYNSNGKKTRTINLPGVSERVFPDAMFSESSCYLEFYDLEELKFAKFGRSNPWLNYGRWLLAFAACAIVGYWGHHQFRDRKGTIR
jgi:hypothetical protein